MSSEAPVPEPALLMRIATSRVAAAAAATDAGSVTSSAIGVTPARSTAAGVARGGVHGGAPVAQLRPGARSRLAYRLTPAGRALQVVLGALQQWGDEHLPRPEGPSMLRRVRGTDCPVHVGYLDGEGREVPLADVAIIPAARRPPHSPTSP